MNNLPPDDTGSRRRRLDVLKTQLHPRYVVWELTLRCDHACTHCGSRAGVARETELSTKQALRVVDQLAEMGTGEVVLIGGEAYLHDGFLDVIRALRRKKITPILTTGGRGVTPELAREMADAGMARVSVSIDGLRETHDAMRARKGSFDGALEALANVRAAGLVPQANTNFNRFNMADLEPLYELLVENGVRAWQVQLTAPLGRAADRPEMLLQPYDLLDLVPRIAKVKERGLTKNLLLMPGNNLGYFGPEEGLLRSQRPDDGDHWGGCQAGRYVMGIESDGAVKGCPSLQTKSYVGGNLLDRSLQKIWDEADELAFARARTKGRPPRLLRRVPVRRALPRRVLVHLALFLRPAGQQPVLPLPRARSQTAGAARAARAGRGRRRRPVRQRPVYDRRRAHRRARARGAVTRGAGQDRPQAQAHDPRARVEHASAAARVTGGHEEGPRDQHREVQEVHRAGRQREAAMAPHDEQASAERKRDQDRDRDGRQQAEQEAREPRDDRGVDREHGGREHHRAVGVAPEAGDRAAGQDPAGGHEEHARAETDRGGDGREHEGASEQTLEPVPDVPKRGQPHQRGHGPKDHVAIAPIGARHHRHHRGVGHEGERRRHDEPHREPHDGGAERGQGGDDQRDRTRASPRAGTGEELGRQHHAGDDADHQPDDAPDEREPDLRDEQTDQLHEPEERLAHRVAQPARRLGGGLGRVAHPGPRRARSFVAGPFEVRDTRARRGDRTHRTEHSASSRGRGFELRARRTMRLRGVTFEELGLSRPLLRAIQETGYTEPTPIQKDAIPPALDGRDVLGCAQTGTGKTAAFGLPLLQRLDKSASEDTVLRALVLTPTRELAAQIADSFKTYGKHLDLWHTVIFGGVNEKPQIKELDRGIDALVATPGRLLDLMGRGFVDLSEVEIFVLDEADRMLDMGFLPDVKRVIEKLPTKRQTLFFSATMPPPIRALSDRLLDDPVSVAVDPVSSAAEKVSQHVYFVDKADKRRLLVDLLRQDAVEHTLVFTRTKHGANRVVKHLDKAGIEAAAIHGNKSQGARTRALDGFRTGALNVLVATDIAARGIDVEGITHVINFDLPNVAETYVHRIGRTARAGASGIALSFCEIEERPYLVDIERLLGKHLERIEEHRYPPTEPLPRLTDLAGRGGGGGGRRPSGGGRPGQQRGRRGGRRRPRGGGRR